MTQPPEISAMTLSELLRVAPTAPAKAQPSKLEFHHYLGLVFLKHNPNHELGTVDTDEKMTAAIVFADLMDMGFVAGTLAPGGGLNLTTDGALKIAHTGTKQ
jgi:hypothetical protein